MTAKNMAGFLTHLFDVWNQNGIRYLILRNYDQLPEFTDNDIDILLDPARMDEAVTLLCRTADRTGWQLHNIGEYACRAFYLFNSETLEQVHLDLMREVQWHAFPFLNAHRIRESRWTYKNFYIPAPSHEAVESLLTPLIYRGRVKDKYRKKISDAAADSPREMVCMLSSRLGEGLAKKMVACTARGAWEDVETLTGTIRRKVLLSNVYHPVRFAAVLWNDLCRFFRRIGCSPGLSIVFFGPDGCGKTSVANGLKERLQKTFYSERSIHCHWKPVRPKGGDSAPTVDPHGAPPRNRLLSLLYFGWHYLPFIWGWWLCVKPVLFKSGLVIIDRYYYDFFVDQRRYRMNVSQWIVRFGFVFVKKPDLVFCLDAAPEILQARKAEVSFEECRRQREAYRDLAGKLPNGHVIDAFQPLDDVVRDVQRVVLNFMAERAARRIGIS